MSSWYNPFRASLHLSITFYPIVFILLFLLYVVTQGFSLMTVFDTSESDFKNIFPISICF